MKDRGLVWEVLLRASARMPPPSPCIRGSFSGRTGISAARNSRARSKLKFPKPDVKLKASKSTDTSIPMDPFKGAGDSTCKEIVHNGGMKSASLKDLCPEDKRRIANLIKELARVSEEKEVTEERLKAEQESFEKKIRKLEEQNELIIREREALQQQYRECQELLKLYQKYLSEQQEKLTLSLSELGTGKVKEQQQVPIRKNSPDSPHQEENDAYRNLTSSQNYQNKNEPKFASQSSAPETNPCFESYSHRIADLQRPQDGLNREQTEARICNLKSPGTRLMGSILTKRTLPNEMRNKEFSHLPPYVGGYCRVQGYPENEEPVHRSHQAGITRHHPRTHHCESCSYCGLSWIPCEPVTLGHEEMDDKKQMPVERRKQLLLQKMELEIEKERLQHLLTSQETQLLLKQQQLFQSRLDYSRLKRQAAFNSRDIAIDGEALSKKDLNLSMNGIGTGLSFLQSKPDDYLHRTPTPSKGIKLHSTTEEGNSIGKKPIGFRSNVKEDDLWMYRPNDTNRSRRGEMSRARKDATTSPIMPVTGKDFVTTATSPFQCDTARYNTSLLDLVHSLSPRSASRPRPPLSREAYAWNHSPVQVFPRKLAWASRASGQCEELEESRMLEEIFFI
ncbi:protein hinderin isoform X1 [Monodelphis domestica]|uniref:protein hinderin isoform X1 n=1 Tax=Monodelphis domestica TaxID=13616 RepID=UPI0024E237B5|nr:protein hinderin isoform X1 [Monodelphis domestica]